RRRHTRFSRDWSSDVCSSDLTCPTISRRWWFMSAVRSTTSAASRSRSSGRSAGAAAICSSSAAVRSSYWVTLTPKTRSILRVGSRGWRSSCIVALPSIATSPARAVVPMTHCRPIGWTRARAGLPRPQSAGRLARGVGTAGPLPAVGDDQPVVDRNEGGDPSGVGRQPPGGLPHALRSRGSVGLVEDPAAPEHVVDDQHPAGAQFLLDDVERGGVALLVDVVEDQVERPFGLPQRLHRLADPVAHDIAVAEALQVPPCALGQLLIPDDVVDLTAAVLLHGASEPGGGVAVARSQLEDAPRPGDPRDLVAEVT